MIARTNDRQAILDRLKAKSVTVPDLPAVKQAELTTFEDPLDQFAQMLDTVGGQLHQVDQQADVGARLAEIPEFRDARQVASLLPVAAEGNVDSGAISDPHDLRSLDWVVCPGEFMVAENGAIWIDGSTLPHRAMLFITQFLAIVVPRQEIVNNMHQAYARIGTVQASFGVFVSGPSKTADIEQSLVLGAHGCRGLQVFAVANS